MNKRTPARNKTHTNNNVTVPLKRDNRAAAGLGDNHPLDDIIGAYEGPVWERVLKNMHRNRKVEEREGLGETE